jgi:hypothetical protein
MTLLGVFVAWPWLALLPAALFLALYRASRRKTVAAAGVIWLLYAVYEYAMQRRWLCSGECNIRVDLLLLYPFLVLISVIAGIVAVRAMMRKPGGTDSPR